MEWLKELLKDSVAEEKIVEVVEKFKQESPKYVIPKAVFNEKSEELKTIKSQLEEQKKLADELGQKANNVDEYEQKLAEWKTKYDQLEVDTSKKVSEITKRSVYKDLLLESNVHKDALDLLLETAKLDEVEVVDGKIKDSDKIVQALKEQRAGLFITEEQSSTIKNEQSTNHAVDPSTLSIEDYTKWFNEREKIN